MAATTASERRKQRQEELREKLQGAKYLHYIEEMDERLRSGSVTRDELDVIKVRLDLNFKRLAKLLPDDKEVFVDADVKAEMGIYEIERRIVKATDSNG